MQGLVGRAQTVVVFIDPQAADVAAHLENGDGHALGFQMLGRAQTRSASTDDGYFQHGASLKVKGWP